jgi:D-alanyl-D-alanine carboxypeptidase
MARAAAGGFAAWSLLLAALAFSCVPGEKRLPASAEGAAPGAASGAAAEAIPGSAGASESGRAGAAGTEEAELLFPVKVQQVLSRALLPGDLARRVLSAAVEGPDFILDLLVCLERDPSLRRLVDKSHALPEGYEPEDLAELAGGPYNINRQGLMLRAEAASSLARMAAEAQAAGAVLLAASAYRSYEYQVEVYARNVASEGQEEADRVSARPGHSQHQTGLAVDFGPIDNSFADTPGGRWLPANAARFGWSLSFPDGYEEVTGYAWESWHYRYVGPELAAFINAYFDGIQQHALRFIYEWEQAR